MSFRVIDDDGPDKEEQRRQRDREIASSHFSWAVREMAANLLRVIRGAGKPHDLLSQMQETINHAVAFRDAHGLLPDVSQVLELPNEREAILARGENGSTSKASIDRWWEDGTFSEMSAERTIYKGVLQIVASELIDQRTQKSAGEDEFHKGLDRLEKVREARVQRYKAEQRANRPVQKKAKAKKAKSAKPRKTDIIL